MEIIIHRVNTLSELKETETRYGAEIDIRTLGSELILNHEPYQKGEKLVNYLDEYHHGTLVLNIKEDGIENDILCLVRERPEIKSYFLLDVEFPYLYCASRQGERNIAIRFSENESVQTVEKYVGKLDWVWIDTNTELPITNVNKAVLDQFKKCLVCPERWGRKKDIMNYKKILEKLHYEPNAVMTSFDCIKLWE